jgi:anti-sigma B factor antagonist
VAYVSCSSCGLSVLRPAHDPINMKCPSCGGPAAPLPSVIRETRTPEFTCEIAPEGDLVLVRPAGELDLLTADQLEVQLGRLLSVGFRHLVVDMRDLTFIDSAGIRLLVMFDQRARDEGLEFELIEGSKVVQTVLEVSGVSERLKYRVAPPAAGAGRLGWRA